MREAGGSFATSAAEYVTEESRDVVGRDELNAFHDDVDTLRDDVERIAARVARLGGTGPSGSPAHDAGVPGLAHRPRAAALPTRRPARRHPGRTLAETRAPVRTGRVGGSRGTVA